MIIGTAGHIDHGKTALVKALTGVDGDRLKEEKARGITIDLGFAYMPANDGKILGFIDVPGHERLVHTMLAGASGIDLAMLVIAADDGMKPQTREHLAILDLLGITHGVIALTKADLVSSERLAEVMAEIRAAVAGTHLEGVEIKPVSALTGEGIGHLRDYLVNVAEAIPSRSPEGRFRLAIDRVFTLAGVGVVVTGTVLSGFVGIGANVEISPSGLLARVRSIHAQNKPAEIAWAGDRCALNLAGPAITKDAIQRGDVVVDPSLHAPTDRIDAVLRVLSSEEKALGQWFPVRLHHAATEVGARIVLLDDKSIPPGATAMVQLVLDRPIAAAVPDRFVIRDVSAQRTIGGGKFIDLRAPARKRRTAERRAQLDALAIGDPEQAFSKLLSAPPFVADLNAFARDRALSSAQAECAASALELVVLTAGETATAMMPDRWQTFVANLTDRVTQFHSGNPDVQGIGREQLRLAVEPHLPKAAFKAAIQRITNNGAIVLDGAFVRLASHQSRLSLTDEEIWASIARQLGGEERFRPPRVRDIANSAGMPEREVRRLMKSASRLGRADEIAHDHFFLRHTVREMVQIAIDLAAKSETRWFNAAEFRDRLNNGRKVAIQILEFFDRNGVTLRKGDLRRMNEHRLDLFGDVMQLSPADNGGESSPVGRSDFKSEWGSEPALGGFDSHSPPPTFPKTRTS